MSCELQVEAYLATQSRPKASDEYAAFYQQLLDSTLAVQGHDERVAHLEDMLHDEERLDSDEFCQSIMANTRHPGAFAEFDVEPFSREGEIYWLSAAYASITVDVLAHFCSGVEVRH